MNVRQRRSNIGYKLSLSAPFDRMASHLHVKRSLTKVPVTPASSNICKFMNSNSNSLNSHSSRTLRKFAVIKISSVSLYVCTYVYGYFLFVTCLYPFFAFLGPGKDAKSICKYFFYFFCKSRKRIG